MNDVASQVALHTAISLVQGLNETDFAVTEEGARRMTFDVLLAIANAQIAIVLELQEMNERKVYTDEQIELWSQESGL